MRLARAAFLVLLVTLVIPANSQTYDQNLFKEMKWRLVGPFRGGRALAVTGVAGEPNLYYFGAVAGGVWKTVDSGANWKPLFDQQPIASIGAIAVADSDHNVIYVGARAKPASAATWRSVACAKRGPHEVRRTLSHSYATGLCARPASLV